MSRKSKGANAERELIHLFNNVKGWCAVRVAGSGSNAYPSPDIVAGNGARYLAIECKSFRGGKKYVPKEDLEQLSVFAALFGAELWVAVRFMGKPWQFLTLENLEDTGKSMAVSLDMAQLKGLSFEKLVGIDVGLYFPERFKKCISPE